MIEEIDYGSICSGIEAASLAWECLGFKPRWFAEIEPFPSAVLAHRWPATPNLGDMTKLASRVLAGSIAAPDVLVGGTPCQAFSVAGMRAGLDDPRGQLTIKYVELADAVDHVRPAGDECVIVWENVPGVLSDKGNAFGCFLGALVGESDALQPSGGKWTDAGCVYGPRRTAAWRVLDAQYFGLAQRRRRVFVVASARKGFDPAAVLFERDGVRRDTPPSREAGQDAAICPTLRAGGNSTGGDRPPGTDVDTADSLQVVSIHGTQDPDVRHNQAHTLGRNSGQENAVFAIQDGALRTNPASGPDGVGVQANHAYTLEARAEVQAAAFQVGPQAGKFTNLSPTLDCRSKNGPIQNQLGVGVIHGYAVRRLTPRECERLQGFPDDWTLIPWRGKSAEECPDGPRYKAIGNSKAVPVVRWIGRQIKQQLER